MTGGKNALDLLWTSDLGPSKTGSIPLVKEPSEPRESQRRNFERFDVSHSMIQVAIRSDDLSQVGLGHVRDASVTGMWIASGQPLEFRTLVRVEICMPDGVRMEFAGRVVRSADDGFAIHLDTSDEDWRFRAAFIELATDGAPIPPRVEVRITTEDDLVEFTQRESELRELRRLWDVAEKDIESDLMHQEFITECVRVKRVEFALERYRELKSQNPDNPLVEKYLQQIGTILSFYTLQKSPPVADPNQKKNVLMLVILLVVLVFAAFFITQVMVVKHRGGEQGVHTNVETP